MSNWLAAGSATMIGSMPHRDRDWIVRHVIDSLPEVPVWPQLAWNKQENMINMFLEGFPGIREKNGSIIVKTDDEAFDQELYEFYEEYLKVEEGTLPLADSRFALGPETGVTFRRFIEVLREAASPPRAVKGQVTGPFSMLATLKDQNGRIILFDERLPDVVAKLMAMKARWQIERLKEWGVPVIIFMDEPGLAGYGSSAFVGVGAEEVRQMLNEVCGAIQDAGGLAGIHVCANTDWLLALDSPIDIINVDAYGYMDKFLMYRDEVIRYMKKGGIVAWGIVPTLDKDKLAGETSASLAERWFEGIKCLESKDFTLKDILDRSLFTPSCGCGTLSEADALRVLVLTREVSGIMRDELARR